MKFICFLNSYSQGISGGDACFVNFSKIVSTRDNFLIVTSKLGSKLCRQNKIRGKYILTSNETQFSNTILTYISRTIRALRILSKQTNSEIIYSTSDFMPDVLPAFMLKTKNPQSVWVQKIFHIIPKSRPIPHFFQLISFQLIRHLADLVVLDNYDLEKTLKQKYGFAKVNTITIPPGINLKEFKKTKRYSRKISAAFMGQLRKSKGIFDLVPIWKKVVKTYPKATLIVIGKDINNNASVLNRQIESEGLSSNIIVMGFLSESRARSIIKTANLFVLPSYEEGFGIVILEAMALSTQPIAYNLPVYKANFPGCVMTAPLGDHQAMAELIVKHLKHNKPRVFTKVVRQYNLPELVEKEYQQIKKIYEKNASR